MHCQQLLFEHIKPRLRSFYTTFLDSIFCWKSCYRSNKWIWAYIGAVNYISLFTILFSWGTATESPQLEPSSSKRIAIWKRLFHAAASNSINSQKSRQFWKEDWVFTSAFLWSKWDTIYLKYHKHTLGSLTNVLSRFI